MKTYQVFQRTASMALVAAAMGPAPVMAQLAATDDGTNNSSIEEIVVTAQRRSENLQKVPLAVTALNAEQWGE